MTKDYAKGAVKKPAAKERNSRAAHSNNEETSLPVKPFVSGAFFGVCLCLGAQWFLQQGQADNSDTSLTESITTETVTGPVLDFYTKLREIEVIVPEATSEEEAAAQADVQYLLQAGSFRDAGDADSMRAQLILLNLDAEISKFNHNGEIWHRVIVGPFPERSSMAKTRTTLLENGIESLLLTQPIQG